MLIVFGFHLKCDIDNNVYKRLMPRVNTWSTYITHLGHSDSITPILTQCPFLFHNWHLYQIPIPYILLYITLSSTMGTFLLIFASSSLIGSNLTTWFQIPQYVPKFGSSISKRVVLYLVMNILKSHVETLKRTFIVAIIHMPNFTCFLVSYQKLCFSSLILLRLFVLIFSCDLFIIKI